MNNQHEFYHHGIKGQSLGRMGGQSTAMLVGGYKPSKYRD